MRPLLALAALAACGSPDPANRAAPELSAPHQLLRASMALTGTRPSLAAMKAVAADPGRLPAEIDALLDRPEFLETVRDIHAESLLVRTDALLLPNVDVLARRGATRASVNLSVMEEPLKLVEHVVAEGRPYTEIVTADYTLADRNVADVWGMPHDDARGGWQVARWPDGRPAAGILSSSAMWLRHESNGFNFHRERANLVARALLCHDFLSRDVPIDGTVDLADPGVVAHAVSTRPECASCHQGLDPLASYFFGMRGFVPLFQLERYPIAMWMPGEQDRWMDASGRPPGYFGDPGGDLAGLGRKIAADPRFSACAARRFYGYFAGIDPAEVPFDVAVRLQRELETSGFDARALARAAVTDTAFVAVDAGGLPSLVKARPEQLARMFEDLTGFRWKSFLDLSIDGAPFGEVDLARSDVFGFRSLAGGIDAEFVTQPARTVNASSALFLRSLSARAAGRVVDDDLAAPRASRRLLDAVEVDTTDETAVRAQLAGLHLRLFGDVLDARSPEVTETYSLFRETLRRTGDVRHAWKTTLTGMLQDLRIAFY